MKNFLKIGIIIFSLIVIFLLGTFNIKAYERQVYYDINDINISGINNLTGHTNYYTILYGDIPGNNSIPNNSLFIFFFSRNTARLDIISPDTSSYPQYYNSVCASQSLTGGNACFSDIYSDNGLNPRVRFTAGYYSTDLGNTWHAISNINTYYSLGIFNSAYVIKTTATLTNYNRSVTLFNSDYELSLDLFNIDFDQGEVIIKNSGGVIANLVTYYLEPDFDNFIPDNFIFSYIENTSGGGFRDSYQFNLTYVENGITYNGNTYHYYFNLPLSYNTGLTFSISSLDYELIQENQFSAYLSSLTDISGFTMYDFRNYEFADMSYINSGAFGLSYQLNTDITINAINYNTNTKIDFLTSSYLINSFTDNNGVTWYEFDFNNDYIYLEFINNFNDTTDFYTYIDTYDLYLYFDNDAYVHLSGSPNSIETQDNVVNQSAYKDNQGNIIYNNNPIVIEIDNSNEFFQNLQRYFKDFDNNTFGLTGIITSPLNLIQNLLSNTCNSLVIPLPYINSNLTLPCMSSIYSQYFGGFYIIYQDITFGLVAYWVIVRILNLVKDFRNPDHDEIEVLDL